MSYKRQIPKDTGLNSLLGPFKSPITVSRHARRQCRNDVTYRPPLAEVCSNVKRDPREGLNLEFKLPVKRDGVWDPPALGMTRKREFIPKALHDPCGEFAIVLYDPTMYNPKSFPDPTLPAPVESREVEADEKITAESEAPQKRPRLSGPTLDELLGVTKSKDPQIRRVPVVIDPKLGRVLRPHQVDGVKFLYKCTMGWVSSNAHGCIMADEMGLGKTLQCITLMWTLLRQSPEGRKGNIEKAIIVCPSSLVQNWAKELDKWLGEGTVTPLAIDGKSVKSAELSEQLRAWASAQGRMVTRPVLIISYETLRRNAAELAEAEIGLLLADEGHRLKNGDSLTFTTLNSLKVKRRVILSGTPIQNDLSEYYSLISFANPGLLGTRAEFHRQYELDILKGRDAFATEKEVQTGETKLNDLLAVVNRFIIRRTNDILSKYLPVKYEHVVYCRLSPLQEDVYRQVLDSKQIGSALNGGQPLQAINLLKKICTHPELLDVSKDLKDLSRFPDGFGSSDTFGRNYDVHCEYSGKFMVLVRMLQRIRAETDDKIVLISNYTQTLDMIERMCRGLRYGCVRLDGTMAINKRQKLVDRFNNPKNPEFVFLLSSKAGGCGINLVGANRLILLDPDWNPASDQQALARVWRDGQKKDCFVYRFIATGTIEEKIYQRQSMKQSLSSCVVDKNTEVERLFSIDDLRRLFMYNNSTDSETHDTFKCKRCDSTGQHTKAPVLLYGDATTWNHFSEGTLDQIEDKLLRQEADKGIVSFVFQYISH